MDSKEKYGLIGGTIVLMMVLVVTSYFFALKYSPQSKKVSKMEKEIYTFHEKTAKKSPQKDFTALFKGYKVIYNDKNLIKIAEVVDGKVMENTAFPIYVNELNKIEIIEDGKKVDIDRLDVGSIVDAEIKISKGVVKEVKFYVK